MTYPSSHSGSAFSGSGHASPAHGGTPDAPQPSAATTFVTSAAATSASLAGSPGFSRSPRCPSASTSAFPSQPVRTSEGEHQLEKLEFALAVAVTRGDVTRIQSLREQIAALGGNCEEPGT
ncbi:MAG: hypothetical protein FJ077_10755 [Cyanobacteria bacterium K_DeepCast_35m_m2_023]|nr:hypothetical protein [Cyanobacteria bacterium K_DeepCast_35m_m2_023]